MFILLSVLIVLVRLISVFDIDCDYCLCLVLLICSEWLCVLKIDGIILYIELLLMLDKMNRVVKLMM